MLREMWDAFEALLGIGLEDLGIGQMALRAVVVLLVTVAVVRMGDKRLFGKGTAFDLVVSIMIGSVMSRAITASSSFYPTLVAGAVLVGIHWLLAFLAVHLDWFGAIVKGNPVLLVEDGRVVKEEARASAITRNDLEQVLRSSGSEPDISQVKRAWLERDGTISVIPRQQDPRVLEVAVADGVQTVRIALE